jgi:hypothetical protein
MSLRNVDICDKTTRHHNPEEKKIPPSSLFRSSSYLIFDALHRPYKITRINFLLSVAFEPNSAAKERLSLQ